MEGKRVSCETRTRRVWWLRDFLVGGGRERFGLRKGSSCLWMYGEGGINGKKDF